MSHMIFILTDVKKVCFSYISKAYPCALGFIFVYAVEYLSLCVVSVFLSVGCIGVGGRFELKHVYTDKMLQFTFFLLSSFLFSSFSQEEG